MVSRLISVIASVALVVLPRTVLGDVYLNNPRGSNNKLSETNNNRQNGNRMFDSQNNNNGGYQVGDNCQGACKDGNNNYHADPGKGAMKGKMHYFQGSELYIEWHAQHGCGVDAPNLYCQMIIQYMCGTEKEVRDGTLRANNPTNTAGGPQEPPTEASHISTIGQHEPLEYYLKCKQRSRNKGLYTADQNVVDNQGATATRQNRNGNNNANNRNGLECPEERDYYPYWHPTPWRDIVVLTNEPHHRCDYYRNNSENVKPRNYCEKQQHNNEKDCIDAESKWMEKEAHNIPPPECLGSINSRDNHNGNVRNGQPDYYLWKIPDDVEGSCVLRLRYNITTGDFAKKATINSGKTTTDPNDVGEDYFHIDKAQNNKNPDQDNGRRRRTLKDGPPVLRQEPTGDFLNIGKAYQLELQVNTNQYGRTFQDRTHSFEIRKRPDDISSSSRIVNYNVRGRRGNIVQVYPSVEYDFVPTELKVERGDYLHFQWAGSDANPNGNAGNGRAGTDRSNLVQIADRSENVPLDIEHHTLFFDASRGVADEEKEIVEKFAYLNQDLDQCDHESNNDNDPKNCKQLNRASAYFDGGLVRMNTIGKHHVMSTRNNDFSNRSQKATITVVNKKLRGLALAGVVGASGTLILIAIYLGAAAYAFHKPTSWLFSSQYRPRVLKYLVKQEKLEHKLEERRSFQQHERENLKKNVEEFEMAGLAGAGAGTKRNSVSKEGLTGGGLDTEHQKTRIMRMLSCGRCGVTEHFLGVMVYLCLNVVVFAVGAYQHHGMGFQGHWAYEVAKGGGFMLDLNFAMLVLPTLKSLQTAMGGVGGPVRELIPIDDPIAFHMFVAKLIAFASFIHIAAHCVHIADVASSPPIQHDELELLDLSSEEHASGTPVINQVFNASNRFAPVSGIVVFMLMFCIYTTASERVRRTRGGLLKKLGGYNLFWRMHSNWMWVYVLLLLHAPARLWIWFFFPALFVAMDKLMLMQGQRPYASLISARLLAGDVIHLTFDVPSGFIYQAGQYILVGWRDEWHPFTLTSAPEERVLSVHIRAPDMHDWCSDLRRRLVEDAPKCAGMAVASPAPVGTEIQYSTCVDLRTKVVYSRPHTGSGPAIMHVAEEGAANEPVSFISGADAELPPDAVLMQLSGPFGAPAQRVWDFNTIMIVGAGIGVTPFAAILRSVQLRAQQRNLVLGRALNSKLVPAEHNKAPTLRGRTQASRTAQPKGGATHAAAIVPGKDREELAEDMFSIPKRIHFVWICASQQEFDWFYGLLCAAADGPAKDIIEINVFTTREVELSKVRVLECAQHQFFGRPNWGRIFKQLKEQHPSDHIGVFLCGSPEIGAELSKQSHSNSDHTGNGTKFSFFKEHF